MKRISLWIILFLLVVTVVYGQDRTLQENSIVVTTDKKDYSKGEEIKIFVKNNGEDRIVISDTSGIDRFESNGWTEVAEDECYCLPGSISSCERSLYPLEPGKIYKTEWDQRELKNRKDCTFKQAIAGKYRVRYFYKDKDHKVKPNIYSESFSIR